jgi:Trypsin-like peptidase domain
VATITLPSVRSLLIQMRVGDQPLGTGTGFVVQAATGPVLLTNRHNVTGRRPDNGEPLSPTGGIPDSVVIHHNRKATLGEWVARIEPLYTEDKQRWVEHPILGSKADFVALPLTQLSDVELYPYDTLYTGPQIRLGPAQMISVIGFPFGIRAGGSLAVWATGFVASELDIDFENLPIFLIDCRTRPGQSGSAVILYGENRTFTLEDGDRMIMGYELIKLLGIYSGRINEQSDLGIVWKLSALRELVESIKVTSSG